MHHQPYSLYKDKSFSRICRQIVNKQLSHQKLLYLRIIENWNLIAGEYICASTKVIRLNLKKTRQTPRNQ